MGLWSFPAQGRFVEQAVMPFGNGLPLPFEEVCIHKVQKDIPSPTVFERLSHKEHRLLRLVETFVYDISMMAPRNTPSCNSL